MYLYIFISLGGDFPGGPVVRTLPSNARVAGLIPGFGELRGFPGGSNGKESTCNVGDLCSVPELRRSPGEGKDYPLRYSGLENTMDRIVYGVGKSRT